MSENVWVAIEISRQIRLVDGVLASAAALAAGGRNLLLHQIEIAKQLTMPEMVCVITPQGDEGVLELIAEHGLRELAPFDFIAMLADRAKHGETGAVVLLRQIAPLKEAASVGQALSLLNQHPVVISASKPPDGHKRHQPLPDQTEPDYRCLAFEVRRMSEFGERPLASVGAEELLYIDWDAFAEYIRPEDEPEVAAMLKSWTDTRR